LIGAGLALCCVEVVVDAAAVTTAAVDVAAATMALAESTRGFFAGGVGGSDVAETALASMLLSDRFNAAPLASPLAPTNAAQATNNLSEAAATCAFQSNKVNKVKRKKKKAKRIVFDFAHVAVKFQLAHSTTHFA
jgi:hypothetical protein